MEEPGQVPGDLALAAADEADLAGEPLEDAVGDRARPAQRVELALVLDRAQPLDEAGARHEVEPVRRRSASTSEYGSTSASNPIRPERLSASQPISERLVSTTSTPSTARAASM